MRPVMTLYNCFQRMNIAPHDKKLVELLFITVELYVIPNLSRQKANMK